MMKYKAPLRASATCAASHALTCSSYPRRVPALPRCPRAPLRPRRGLLRRHSNVPRLCQNADGPGLPEAGRTRRQRRHLALWTLGSLDDAERTQRCLSTYNSFEKWIQARRQSPLFAFQVVRSRCRRLAPASWGSSGRLCRESILWALPSRAEFTFWDRSWVVACPGRGTPAAMDFAIRVRACFGSAVRTRARVADSLLAHPAQQQWITPGGAGVWREAAGAGTETSIPASHFLDHADQDSSTSYDADGLRFHTPRRPCQPSIPCPVAWRPLSA